MCHVSAQGIDECMINVRYYYYYYSHSDCPEESVEEVNSPSTSKGRARGTGVGEKCNALEVWLWLGVRTKMHGTDEERLCGIYSFMSLVHLCDSVSS